MSSCVIFALLSKLVQSADGDCTTNQWPYSCEANSKIGRSGCEPCEMGKYGYNCSQVCSIETYGLNCYHHCNCSPDEVCDPTVGCTNVITTVSPTTLSQSPTRIHNSSSMKSSSTPTNVVSSSNAANPPSTHTGITPLQSLATSLLVSLTTVIVFSTICACILVRVSKRFYKREYRKLQNLWQSNKLTAGGSNIYSVYDYTGSFVVPSSILPTIPDNNTYDQSDQSNSVSYNVLSLRNFPSTVNDYDDECNSVLLPPRSKSSGCETSEWDFELEPQCLSNLFKEEEESDMIPCRRSYPGIVQSEPDGEIESHYSTKL